MSECKHEWKYSVNTGMYHCRKCGKGVTQNQAFVDLKERLITQDILLTAKDRQLEAAARDINELMQECPHATFECKITGCDQCEGKDDYTLCWRKRWDEASKHG